MRLLICLLLFPGCLFSQDNKNLEIQKVYAVVTGMFEGIAELNTLKISKFTTKDFLLLENGAIWNMDTVALKMEQAKKRFSDFKRNNSFDFFRTEIIDQMAWVSFFNQADIVADGMQRKVRWLESAVLIKEDGVWKIQLFHSTVLKEEIK